LPVDKVERDRLSMQHEIWRLCEGDLYPTEISDIVTEVLSTKGGRQPTIFDIGSGSGSWAAEMASAFPDAQVIGLDLAKSKPAFTPPNCSFVVGDITHEVPEYMEKFDLVHCRAVASHVAEPVALVRRAANCVKPGGLCIFEDGSFVVHNENKKPAQPAADGVDNEGRSWLARWMLEMRSRMTRNFQNPVMSAGAELFRWLQDDGHLKVLERKTYFCPVNWDGDEIESGHELGQLWAVNAIQVVEAGRPLFLGTGLPNDVLENWVQNIRAEVDGPKVRVYFPLYAVCALKG